MNKYEVKAGIIDYGVGNVNSVQNALKTLGFRSIISSDKVELEKCSHLILPGVGAFDKAFSMLEKSELITFLENQAFNELKPILGICVGMQLMMESSTENGFHKGLSWIKGHVDRIDVPSGFKLPHVGWNNIDVLENSLFQNVDMDSDFYFDHTYRCFVKEDIVSAIVNYPDPIHAAISKKNIHAIQFHPEKSQIQGLRVFKSFMNLC